MALSIVNRALLSKSHRSCERTMVDDNPPKNVVQFPNAEERARRLRVEVERLSQLPTVEWMFYVESEGYAERYGVDKTALKRMIGAIIKANEKKAKEDRGELRRREDRAERQHTKEKESERKEERRERVEERKRQEREEQEVRKEAEREEARRKKCEAVFAEIADLPKLTHEVRLKEAARRLGEDFEVLVDEFTIYCEARKIPEDLKPWPEPVDTAELLETIETKFRRYVVASEAVITASVLWPCFTYVAEVATHAPKLVYTFPERDAGKSTALHTLRWMSQRAYMAVDVTAAVTFRILDRLRPTLFLDEADSAFSRGTVLATIFNTSWLNGGSKIPRTGRHGEIEEFECYGPQAFAMRKLLMPDTTLSRCIVCMMWPKLPERDSGGLRFLRRRRVQSHPAQGDAVGNRPRGGLALGCASSPAGLHQSNPRELENATGDRRAGRRCVAQAGARRGACVRG